MKDRMMDRRTMLKRAGLAALGLGLGMGSGCSVMRRSSDTEGKGRRQLAKIDVSEERVTGTLVGIRPYRPSGFVVRSERFGEKIVIHNYGHGGGGVSLSWGTARLAVEEALATRQWSFAVIGCGCVGLATAVLLRRRGFDVTIYAKDLPRNTTSNAAGAIWSPFAVADPDACAPEFGAEFEGAARLSHRYFEEHAGGPGVRWIDCYALSDRPIEPQSSDRIDLRDLFRDRQTLAPGEHPFPAPHAERFRTMLIDMPVYLNALMDEMVRAGGRIVLREFGNRNELLVLPEPVIVNCTGIGARTLFDDGELVPIKGQFSVLPPREEIDYVVACPGEHLLMLPRTDGILLGSTFQPDEWSLEPDKAEAKRVIEGHRRIFGALRSAG